MKKQVLTVYVCDHCGKISRSAGALTLHERWCKKNPAMRPLCYGCKNYHITTAGDEQPITVTHFNPYIGEIEEKKFFQKNKCTCLSVYLFNGCRMYEETKQALMGKGLWRQMPTGQPAANISKKEHLNNQPSPFTKKPRH